ncbi:MAG: hypothetical protein Q4G09_02240, partial [Clostridia bacterium]|nr:hypothetical protein [Clostridia bacterium]
MYASINDYPDNPIYTASVGDFVQYDVAYTDVYKNYQYTNKNGWRILRYETADEGETITNVEIISTGIPAKLYYYSGNQATWWETAEPDTTKLEAFQTALGNYWTRNDNKTYPFSSITGANVKASVGMYNNFASIPFIYTVANYNNLSNKYNIGWYKAVTHGENEKTVMTSNKNGGELFLTGDANKVRLLTLPEINNTRAEATTINSTETIETEPAPGLFK